MFTRLFGYHGSFVYPCCIASMLTGIKKTKGFWASQNNQTSKREVAPSEGLEPSTYELTARCSTELSYDGSINDIHDVAILRICGDI